MGSGPIPHHSTPIHCYKGIPVLLALSGRALQTIREYRREGLLKAVQLKRSYRIRRAAYEEFLRRRETGQR